MSCNNQFMSIACPIGAINVTYANFGRSVYQNSCGTHKNVNCYFLESLSMVQSECNGRTLCEFYPGQNFFKIDPCMGVIKYTEVEWICGESSKLVTLKS